MGGTSLYLGQSAERQSETVWNDNGVRDVLEQAFAAPLGAGGGGCSTLFSAQHWQTSLSVWGSTGCGSKRLVSDVSAVGDYLTGFDIYDSYNCGSACSPAPGWLTVGGTSLSSPIIAASYALAGGAHGVPYPALTLYGHPRTAYDVTTGGNGWCAGQGAAQCPDPNSLGYGTVDCAYTAAGTPAVGDRACDALAGYDGPTGVGTPDGLAMFTKTGPSATISGPTSVPHGTSQTWKAAVADPFPGGTVASYTWNWGDGSRSTTTTGTAGHTYATGSVTRTITLTVKDAYGVTGSATYTVKVRDLAGQRQGREAPARPAEDRQAGRGVAVQGRERQMLRPSFVPPPQIRRLRDLTRYRADLVAAADRGEEAGREAAGRRLASSCRVVASRTFSGSPGRDDDGRAGGRGAQPEGAGAAGADAGCGPKITALEEAFTGHFTDHHAFLLAKMLARVDGINADIAELDARIEEHDRPFRGGGGPAG